MDPPRIPHLARRLAVAARRGLSGLALVGLLASTAGCATYIDKAREAKDNRDYAKAEELYRESMEKDKDELDRDLALEELVTMKVEIAHATAKSDPTKAEKIYRDALKLNPRDEEAQDGLARVLASIGRIDEAVQILGGEAGFGKCDLCERYLAVLLKKRAFQYAQEEKYEAALADYRRAFQLLADPSTAFAIARILAAMDREAEAAQAIEEAVPTIRQEDREAQAEFVKVREESVMKAIARGDTELADRYMGMFPPGSGGEPWYSLQLRVAKETWRKQDLDGAIARVEPLLGDDHAQTLPDSLRKEMIRFLDQLYTQVGVAHLRAGDADAADKAFARAGELSPEDESNKLLRALAIAGRGDLDRARKVAQAMQPSTRGYPEVQAILESMVVFDSLDRGDVGEAKEALARAQAASPDTPEVHVAAAAILAVTPVEGLSRKDVKTLRRYSLANYSAGIFRYGEALSEIAWAREQSKNLGVSHQWRGPGSEAKMDELERRIRESYPFGVRFNPDPTALLTLRRKSETAEVSIEGPGYEESVFVSASGPPAIKIEDGGLVLLTYGSQKVALLAELYTGVQVELP
ncbi:MAG: tetratricopeptide repeat protein [Nannocystaceae bacterium]